MSDPMSERYKLSDEELDRLRQASEPSPVSSFAEVESLAPIDATDMECFEEIRAVLAKHGKLERFGVALLHKHFDLKEGEALVESTNCSTRTMTLEPEIIDSSDIRAIDTQWYLGKSVPLSLVKCRTNWHQ